MNGEERRQSILKKLIMSKEAIPGVALSKEFDVSRQVIVQDIALLRANGNDIFSTNKGYLIQPQEAVHSRVFKLINTSAEEEEKLNLIIDSGGRIKDVFVYHKVFGVIRADMNIKSRRDIRHYMDELNSGKSQALNNVTSGYHYHTIVADDEQTLDLIQEELQKRGFLAKLQDYEPVNFWGEE